MPSDYRYNPFTDALEPVAITGETHVIPSNSPYTIRLKEVPVKESPSTVSLTIAGVAATEVAAEPAAGEFRCDYTTGADEDDNWNTGLIQFNPADAGKTVVAAYNGMGTLASVNAPLTLPSWAKYRGDGSDGDFFAAGGETLSGIKQYKSFMIGSGLTVNVGADPLFILCQGTVTINGTLNGKGGDGGTGSSSATGGVGVGGGGGGAGGYGSDGGAGGYGSGGGAGGNGKNNGGVTPGGSCYMLNNYVVGEVADNYGSEYVQYFTVAKPFFIAAANATPSAYYQNLLALQFMAKAGGGGGVGVGDGGAGGGGGGTITIVGESVTNTGILNISGGLKSTGTGSNNNYYSGGGGGGASIIIVAKTIIVNGNIIVAGGNAGLGRSSISSNDGAVGWYKIYTAG